MMKLLSIRFVVSLLALLPAGCLAFTDTLLRLQKHYTDADGLPQNSIKSIAQGSRGFIWFTTESGLVRFDGRNFISTSTADFGLRSHRFTQIIPDGQNAFVACTEKGEFLTQRQGRVVVDTQYTKQLCAALDFLPWLPDFHRFGQTGFPDCVDGIRSLTDARDTCIITYNFHTVYVLYKRSVAKYQYKRLVYNIPFTNEDDHRFFLIKDKLYYFDKEAAIYALGPDGATRVPVEGIYPTGKKKPAVKLFWNINSVNNVLLYYNNSFYTLSCTNGIFSAKKILDGFDAEKNGIISVWLNSEADKLLLGSLTNGLYVFSRPLFQPVSQARKADNIYYAQTIFETNKILTPQGIVYEPDRPGISWQSGLVNPISDRYSIVIDKNNYVWTKKENKLYRGALQTPTDTMSWKFTSRVLTIIQGLNDQLWFGLEDGTLLTRDMSASAASPVPIAKMPDAITWLDQQDANTLWIGTINGAYRYRVKDHAYDTIRGLQNKYIRSIYRTTANQLWITTYDNGFFLYDNGKLTGFPADRNNYIHTAHCIIEDKNGFFWISTNNGLFQAAKNDLLAYAAGKTRDIYYHYYSKDQGLVTNEFNGGCEPCGLQMPNGLVSFPAIDGLLWFYPDSLRPELPVQELFVDKILVNTVELPEAATINLPRNLRQVKLFVNTPYMGNPENLHISYALVKDGQQPLWLPVDNGIISLSTLPSGNYRLRIRKANGFGLNNFTEKVIRFYVKPHWIWSPWALLSLLLLLTLLIILLVWVRTRYIRMRNMVLKAQIADQTAVLRQAMHKLERSQQELVTQTTWQQKMLAVLSHDIKAPLKYLMITADKIHEGLQREGSSSYITPSKTVHEYIRRLYHTMDNILRYIKTQITGAQVTMELFDVKKLIDEKIQIYEDIAIQVNSSLHNQVPAGFLVYSNPALLSVILHNLIDNAMKVTEEGTITIEAERKEGEVQIRVKDTGMGMGSTWVTWINMPAQDHPKDAGIGLLIVKGLTPLLHIRMHAASSEAGTTITLTLPDQASER